MRNTHHFLALNTLPRTVCVCRYALSLSFSLSILSLSLLLPVQIVIYHRPAADLLPKKETPALKDWITTKDRSAVIAPVGSSSEVA
jgi:hypothetical protein